MAISYFIQSKKDYAPIWIRYREGKTDAKCRTRISVERDRLVKGNTVSYRRTDGSPEHKVAIDKKNDALNIVQDKLDFLKREVQNAINITDGIIDSQFIKNIVHPNENVNLLSTNIDAFIDYKKTLVTRNTYKSYISLKRLLFGSKDEVNKFQKENVTLLVLGVDLNFRDKLLKYMNENGYANNTIILYIRTLKAILKYAKKRKVKISDDIDYFKDDLKAKKTLYVYLNIDEIKTVYNLSNLTPQEDIARDWLVISCNTAQRVGDLLQYDKKDIKGNILTVQQTKNSKSKPLSIPLIPEVRDILKKYNGNFPPQLNPNPKVSYVYYNSLIKDVCRKAGFNEDVEVLTNQRNNIKGDSVSKVVSKKKWEVVSSHIGRRSFATNSYGKYPSAYIMKITGHKTESNFLKYIDKDIEFDTDKMYQMMVNALSFKSNN